MKTKGKIIAVVGAQASGKSTLVNKLVLNNPAWKAFYEGESFPGYVTNAFTDPNKRILAFLYFHNKWIKQYIEAQKLRDDGRVVILDNFWLSNLFFLDTLLDEDEKKLISVLIDNTSQLFRSPDAVIFLDVDIETMTQRIRERNKKGQRFWENTEAWLAEPLMVRKRYREFFYSASSNPLLSNSTEILRINATEENLLKRATEFIQNCGSLASIELSN